MKRHTIDCAHNTFLLLQKHLTPGTELILIALRCVIPVVCVTNEREESVVNQHN